MASTYTPIATYTATGTISSYTFSSIPSTYTDLVLVVNAAGSSDFGIRFNGDTGTNYSYTVLKGNGTTAASVRSTNTSRVYLVYDIVLATDMTLNSLVSIQNYSNATTNKSVLIRTNQASQGVETMAGLWRNTSAISSLTVVGGSFTIGSTFTLYGIKAA